MRKIARKPGESQTGIGLTENPKVITALDIQRGRRGRLRVGGHFVEGLMASLGCRPVFDGADAGERVVRDG